jgi:hypothetical protein
MDYYLLTGYETGASVCEERLAVLRTQSGARLARLRRDIDLARQVAAVRHPAMWRRALGGLGDALVAAGERLRQGAAPCADALR